MAELKSHLLCIRQLYDFICWALVILLRGRGIPMYAFFNEVLYALLDCRLSTRITLLNAKDVDAWLWMTEWLNGRAFPDTHPASDADLRGSSKRFLTDLDPSVQCLQMSRFTLKAWGQEMPIRSRYAVMALRHHDTDQIWWQAFEICHNTRQAREKM